MCIFIMQQVSKKLHTTYHKNILTKIGIFSARELILRSEDLGKMYKRNVYLAFVRNIIFNNKLKANDRLKQKRNKKCINCTRYIFITNIHCLSKEKTAHANILLDYFWHECQHAFVLTLIPLSYRMSRNLILVIIASVMLRF